MATKAGIRFNSCCKNCVPPKILSTSMTSTAADILFNRSMTIVAAYAVLTGHAIPSPVGTNVTIHPGLGKSSNNFAFTYSTLIGFSMIIIVKDPRNPKCGYQITWNASGLGPVNPVRPT